MPSGVLKTGWRWPGRRPTPRHCGPPRSPTRSPVAAGAARTAARPDPAARGRRVSVASSPTPTEAIDEQHGGAIGIAFLFQRDAGPGPASPRFDVAAQRSPDAAEHAKVAGHGKG